MTAAVAAVLVLVALSPDLASVRPRGRTAPPGRLHGMGPVRPAALLSRWRARSERAEVMSEALELTARSLRSGASVLNALEGAATELPQTGLGPVVSRVRGGLSLAEALDGWTGEERDRQTAAALLVLGHSSGAAMAASLDRAAASLRQRKALGDEVRAITSQTRASGVVVAAAPAGFAAIVAAADRDAVGALFSTPVGLLSLAVGLVLEALGIWWMQRLCRGVVEWA